MNLKWNNTDKPPVNNNENSYILPDPNHDDNKRMSTEITRQLQRDFKNVLVE